VSDLSRRDVVGALAAAAGAFVIPRPAEAQAAFQSMVAGIAQRGGAFAAKVYNPHEWATVRMLVDYIIPKDASSGSATDAQVPEFMDTMLDLEPNMRTAHRGGLAWLDHQSHLRFAKNFVDVTDGDRRAILDDIAYPRKATAEMAMGVAWFNSFRDLTATGFFTSEIGVKDLGYQGNTAVAEWTGCPPENYTKFGVVKPG
jgi:gluconate 2-dehydrogenase gamma chain